MTLSICLPKPTSAHLVQVCQSPYIDRFYKHHCVCIVTDSGATCNIIRIPAVQKFGVETVPSTPSQQIISLKVEETRIALTHDKHMFHFEGLVVQNLYVEILAGTPFMSTNDIAMRPTKHHIILSDGTTVTY